jgi:hypothetical protein
MKNLFVIAMLLGVAATGSAQQNKGNDDVSMNSPNATAYSESALQVNRESIPLNKLPKDAVKYIKENYPMRQIRQIHKVRNNGNGVKYEVKVNIEGKISIVQFDKKGELVDEL